MIRERYTRDFFSKTAADTWGEKRALALILGQGDVRTIPTLGQLWKEYETKHVDGQRLKASHKTALKSLWRNHLSKLESKRLDEIDFSTIQTFKSARTAKAPKTVNNALIALRAMLNFAIKLEYITTAPTIELLKVPKTIPRHYDIPTFNRLVVGACELGDRHAAVVLLGGEAGLRAGEMLALDDTDLALPLLNVRRTLWRGHMGPTKGSAERVVPLTARTVDVLRRLVETSGPVLRTRKGTRLNQTLLQRLLAQAQKHAGVPALSLHKLRHTYGTDVTHALGIRAAQLLLGHADVTTTERYSHAMAAPGVVQALERARGLPAGRGENEPANNANDKDNF